MSFAKKFALVSLRQKVSRFWLLALLSLSAATTVMAQTVSFEADESVDFSKFKTFAIREGHLNSRAPALNSELTKKHIESAIERGLVAKGLTATNGQADLNVTFDFSASREIETKTFPAGPRGMGTRVANVPQSEGVLVIDLHDASSNALVWRSTAMESEANPTKLADKLDNMVKKSIAKYSAKKPKH